jgi:hypothetical protein
MNEKLKEIVKQAGVFYSYQDGVWLATNGDLERFAELIVKECLQVISKSDDECHDEWDYAERDLQGLIREHFGVEL